MTTGYWLDKQWLCSGNMVGGQETLADFIIQSDLWSRSNHDGKAEERSFVTKISRGLSDHYSIRAHLERFTMFQKCFMFFKKF
jgi:hypothetical protein